jgi:hypothetical protein
MKGSDRDAVVVSSTLRWPSRRSDLIVAFASTPLVREELAQSPSRILGVTGVQLLGDDET